MDSLVLKFHVALNIIYLCFGFNSAEIIFHYNNTYKYNEPYTVAVSKNTEYILEFAGDLEAYDTPARVTVASDFANRTYPLFITARQQKGVFSWQLPMTVQTITGPQQFTNISRTLCPHNNIYSEDEEACHNDKWIRVYCGPLIHISTSNTPIVHLTSSSPDPINVTIRVETVQDFYIKLNQTTNLTSTPSQPKYYFYPFDQGKNKIVDLESQRQKKHYMCNQNGDFKTYFVNRNLDRSYGWLSRPKSVILMIESDDDICAVVSIQNFSCPVFDNERDILYDGYYLTMTRRGGITLTQDTFPIGFYIVFIVKTSDEVCTGQATNTSLPKMAQYLGWDDTISVPTNDGRVKNFSLRVIETISYQEYIIAAGVVLAFFLSFYVAFIIVVICQRKRQQSSEETLIPPDTPHDSSQISYIRQRVDTSGSSRQGAGDPPTRTEGSSSSDTDSDLSTLDDINTEKDLYLHGNKLCVANLSRCRPRVLSARSKMYLWNVLTVAVFYTLPVIQLVITYQRLLNQSGNQDLCYFNFLCAHPLMVLSDFNHVYSNLGYVLLGALFLAEVWHRHRRYREVNKAVGIPQHFGLLYAMGIALVSEGLLSAAYHVCPNSMNFQFDTSFMYVTSVLCMVKIYQSRHPDINARAHATFGVLALIIFIGLVGVLNANFYFWVAFTVLHLITCLVMTFQIYYLGRFRLEAGAVWRAVRGAVRAVRGGGGRGARLAAVAPAHAGRCVLLLLANLANWALAAYGVTQHSRDFASHLLLVLMSNLFLYTLFYIAMKLLHRESIRWYSWVFIALTYTVWFSSSYFYLDLSTNWALTPAQSRQSNRVCSLLQLYDSHDIWHFMSSIAMFFSFNMYLTIDDNLSNVPRGEIAVF